MKIVLFYFPLGQTLTSKVKGHHIRDGLTIPRTLSVVYAINHKDLEDISI